MSNPYVHQLEIVDVWAIQELAIEIPPPKGGRFRHLVLTGRNGSGKSAILKGLKRSLGAPGSRPDKADGSLIDAMVVRTRPAKAPLVRAQPADAPLLAWLPPRRPIDFATPSGPTRAVDIDGSQNVEQILVNWRTQAALAVEGANPLVAEGFRGRIAAFEASLRDLMAPVPVALAFDLTQLRYRVTLDGRDVTFSQLPDGVQAALHLWLELHAGVNRVGGGVAVIDEPETHLHLGLQEKLLPFLAAAFPDVQLIVATHSPAVAASLSDAMVYDLTQRRAWPAEAIHAWRYGRLMTDIFGLDDEYNAGVTQQLERIDALRRKPHRNEEEQEELRALVEALRGSAHPMVLDVWLDLHAPAMVAEPR